MKKNMTTKTLKSTIDGIPIKWYPSDHRYINVKNLDSEIYLYHINVIGDKFRLDAGIGNELMKLSDGGIRPIEGPAILKIFYDEMNPNKFDIIVSNAAETLKRLRGVSRNLDSRVNAFSDGVDYSTGPKNIEFHAIQFYIINFDIIADYDPKTISKIRDKKSYWSTWG